MLKPCTIVLGLAQDCALAEGDLIGADRGALICAQAHRRMVMAIGDFDSVTPPQKELIRQYADQMQVLPAMKPTRCRRCAGLPVKVITRWF